YQVIETGKPITFVMKEKDRWLRILIYPVCQKENNKSVAICNRDITSQIEAEERLKRTVFKLVTTQENERYRISRDLHDEVGQRMTGLMFDLRTIKESIIKEQKISLNVIDNTIRNFETILKNIRQIFYQLHPPSLDKVELPLVLEAFCSTFEERNKIEVDFSCQKEFPSLPEAYAIAIYRFIQEGLTNIAKHSHALSAWISLDYSDNEISIFMEDNGQGFDTKTAREGLGLQGIQERFFPLDGSIEIDSTLGKGTQLSGILPFKVNKG
ncbi:MAG: sensor histidine kinase, partial [Bacillota bacterium]